MDSYFLHDELSEVCFGKFSFSQTIRTHILYSSIVQTSDSHMSFVTNLKDKKN